MGGWYIVIKTIKGRRYRYRQRTWREGGKVRTQSYSLGPVEPSETASKAETSTKSAAKQLVATHLEAVLAELKETATATARWQVPWDPSSASPGTFQRLPAIDTAIKATGARIGHSWDKAQYLLKQDFIEVPDPRSFKEQEGLSATDAYYHTLLHELAHWSGAKSRLDRFSRSGNLLKTPNYAKEELVAEVTAVLVMRAFGRQPNLAHSAAYFRYWLAEVDNAEEALAHARKEAQLAAEWIIGAAVNTTPQDMV